MCVRISSVCISHRTYPAANAHHIITCANHAARGTAGDSHKTPAEALAAILGDSCFGCATCSSHASVCRWESAARRLGVSTGTGASTFDASALAQAQKRPMAAPLVSGPADNGGALPLLEDGCSSIDAGRSRALGRTGDGDSRDPIELRQ